MTNHPEIIDLLRKMTDVEKKAMKSMALPRLAAEVFLLPARPYSSCWRKSAKYFRALIRLESQGIVQSRVSRGETLWRLTKPFGLGVRKALDEQS